jgi:hypothetical protein
MKRTKFRDIRHIYIKCTCTDLIISRILEKKKENYLARELAATNHDQASFRLGCFPTSRTIRNARQLARPLAGLVASTSAEVWQV